MLSNTIGGNLSADLSANLRAMSLSDLRSAGLVVEVYSSLLEDSFLLASDGVEVSAEEEGAVYSVSEIESMLCLAPEELKLIHEVKRRFRCTMALEQFGGGLG